MITLFTPECKSCGSAEYLTPDPSGYYCDSVIDGIYMLCAFCRLGGSSTIPKSFGVETFRHEPITVRTAPRTKDFDRKFLLDMRIEP
jgi:hypothetical protein